jgi:hypothetical protein
MALHNYSDHSPDENTAMPVRPWTNARIDVWGTRWLNTRRVFFSIAIVGGAVFGGYMGGYQRAMNAVTGKGISAHTADPDEIKVTGDLYMIDSIDVEYRHDFEFRVREMAAFHGFPPEWLMAVMYNESHLDHKAVNLKGSGATGLIQFMPFVADELHTSIPKLLAMNPIEQLEYVERFLARWFKKGVPPTLGRFYLTVLYPWARDKEDGYVLYAYPSVKYKQNDGMDENKDGAVTVADVEARMARLYPEAAAIHL